MEYETIVHFKDGSTASMPILPNEFNSDMFNKLEKAMDVDSDIVVYGTNGQIVRKARTVHSIEFVVKSIY
ncbi:hypothetical protein [Oceanobacillus locisalsi]|uniref:DUF2922 domain-containing protein n=1 Tax=Oceanobacillus locisalsi TaxID=546107 RepID=A0ABW3NHP9_9BACI